VSRQRVSHGTHMEGKAAKSFLAGLKTLVNHRLDFLFRLLERD
jgi:hypothetical protein